MTLSSTRNTRRPKDQQIYNLCRCNAVTWNLEDVVHPQWKAAMERQETQRERERESADSRLPTVGNRKERSASNLDRPQSHEISRAFQSTQCGLPSMILSIYTHRIGQQESINSTFTSGSAISLPRHGCVQQEGVGSRVNQVGSHTKRNSVAVVVFWIWILCLKRLFRCSDEFGNSVFCLGWENERRKDPWVWVGVGELGYLCEFLRFANFRVCGRRKTMNEIVSGEVSVVWK